MRSRYFPLAALALAAACADAPVAPLMQPGDANFAAASFDGRPPPPWAMVEGSGTAEHVSFTYVGSLFINKPGNVAWLMFVNGGSATFSAEARLMNVNGRVSGVGTMTVGGSTYQLSSIQSFSADRSCTDGSTECVSFSGGGITSTRSVWTGSLANDHIDKPGGRDPPGGDEVCTIETCFDVIIGNPKGRDR